MGGKDTWKEADEGTDTKKQGNRREEDTAERKQGVCSGGWVSQCVFQAMGGAGRLCGSQHSLERIPEGQFPSSLPLWGEAEPAGDKYSISP